MSDGQFTIEDVGKYFLDSEDHIWQCISFADQPTVVLKCLQDLKTTSISAVGSLNLQGFKRLVPEVQ